MKKALIVDDDHLVRSYLKILPSWERAGFQIEAGARDGEEALGILEKTDVDLLVTDISMPLLNGIELIRRVRQTNQRLYIIALSCHDEFAYVKDAMKEGADDYVLKNTLNEDTLCQLLETTAVRMEERQRQYAEQTHIQRLAKAGDQQLKYAYFSKVIGEALDPNELEQERRRAGLRRPYRNCGAISIRLESWEGEAGSASHPGRRRYCQEFLRRLPDALAEELEDGGERLEIVYWGKGLFYGFLDLSDLRDGSAMRQALTEAALACAKICGRERYPYGVGVSEPCLGADAIRTAYRQANQLMKRRFYERQDVLYYDPSRKAGSRIPPEAETMLAQAERYRRQADPGGFLNACAAAGKSFERGLVDERLVQQWVAELELKAGLPPGEDVKTLSSMDAVYRRLQEDARRLHSSGGDLPQNISRTVSAAAEFVRGHYKEPIGLTETAQAVGVNPTYLSYLFHREAGVGFSNFLLNLRIACAKTLLRETNLKVREVAEQSGFHDYHYFAKAFKKLNGLSPAEYRKQPNSD